MSNFISEKEGASMWMQERGEAMEQAMARVLSSRGKQSEGAAILPKDL